MASNGLSSRRRTLKRPIVCKSKVKGQCGACVFIVSTHDTHIVVGNLIIFDLNLICDPNPTMEDFEVEVRGAFTPNEPPPVVTVNIEQNWHLLAPGTPGDYTLHFSLSNGDACVFFYDLLVPVFPV